jgi:hypothetical protein
MFDFDIAMGACLAQTRCIGERAGAMIVETAQKRREIAMSHGNERLGNTIEKNQPAAGGPAKNG